MDRVISVCSKVRSRCAISAMSNIAIEEKKLDEVEEKDWKTINRLACGTIRSCLSRERIYAFSKETSAHTLWMSLEEEFMRKAVRISST